MTQPDFIIVPTEEAMADFRADVRNMTNHDYDQGEIIKDVFKALQYKPLLKDSIEIACATIIASYARASARDDGVVLANAFGNLAHRIAKIFTEGGAWDSSGFLRLSYQADMEENWVVNVEPCSHSQKPIDNLGRGLTHPFHFGNIPFYPELLPEPDVTRGNLIKAFNQPIDSVKVNNENNPEQ